MGEFVRVAKASDIQPGQALSVEANGKSIGLFNVDGKIFAMDNICKHKHCPLGDGMLSDSVITCPCHGWQYDVTNGKGLTMPVQQDQFNVKIEGEDVLVEV